MKRKKEEKYSAAAIPGKLNKTLSIQYLSPMFFLRFFFTSCLQGAPTEPKQFAVSYSLMIY